MEKLNLALKGKKMLTKEQMKYITGGEEGSGACGTCNVGADSPSWFAVASCSGSDMSACCSPASSSVWQCSPGAC